MAILELSMVTGAIVEMSVEGAAKKINRNETVIGILKRLRFDIEPPADDFEAIYAHTLVEYGIFKPEPLLKFFSNEFVRNAFRQSFYKHDPTILNREAEGIIQWNEETGKLGRIDYDPRREFATFTAVFNEIVDRTRPPADVKRDQKLDEVRERIGQITERLNRLGDIGRTAEIIERLSRIEDLTALRLELTRVAPKGTPGIALSQLAAQLSGWFSTLNYQFESYEQYSNEYFEWVVDVPARRAYDRVVVHGVEGEIETSHVRRLRRSVDSHLTDEGWLVALRRVAPSAREEVSKSANKDLFCYTFDELLDEHANFSRYFDWLEAEVKRHGIDLSYVSLEATKYEFDQRTKQRIGQSRYTEHSGGVDGYVTRWLDDLSKEHLSILGEFGTGKTWLALHYAWVALQRYKEARTEGRERPRIPLVISLRDYAKAVSVESLFSEFFFRKYEIPLPGYSAFEQLNRMGKLLLIFDGFDEMADRVDRQKMINNFWELTRVVVPGAKVILTCRTEHFPTAQEGRALLKAELQASTSKLSGEAPQFEVLELEKFNKDQIRRVLSSKAKTSTVEKIMNYPQLLDLARRPVMTELILEAMSEIEAGKPVDLSRVYLYAVKRKMEQDIKAERTFTSLADKVYFLCEVSWEMLTTNKSSLNYKQFPDRLLNLFGAAIGEQKDMDHWQYDMMGQTMLIRNDDGDYTPAHRSLLEFFVAYKLASEMGILAPDFIEIAQARSKLDIDESASQQDYAWSAYFRRQVDEAGHAIPIPPLRRFESENISKLVLTMGLQPLTKAVVDLMENMLGRSPNEVKETLLHFIVQTAGHSADEIGFIGGNAATLLVQLDSASLKEKHLSNTDLKHARFANADLSGSNFSGANLAYAEFRGTILEAVDFQKANLSGTQFIELSEVFSVAFRSDGQMLASGGIDAIVRVWSTEAGEIITTFRGHEGAVRGLLWNRAGTSIVSISDDESIMVWEVQRTYPINTLLTYSGSALSVAISPTGKYFIVAFAAGVIHVFGLSEDGNVIALEEIGVGDDGTYPSYAGTFGSSDDVILYYGNYGILTARNRRSECEIDRRHLYRDVNALCLSPDRKRVAVGGDRLLLVDAEDLSEIWEIKGDGFDRPVFSSDGRWLYCVEGEENILVTSAATGKRICTFCTNAKINALSIAPNDCVLASGHANATIRLWDARLFVNPHGEPHIMIAEYTPPNLSFIAGDQSTWPKWWRNCQVEVPLGLLPNPDFGKCLRIVEIRLSFEGMKLRGAKGLEAPAPNYGMTLGEWLVKRGAIVE